MEKLLQPARSSRAETIKYTALMAISCMHVKGRALPPFRKRKKKLMRFNVPNQFAGYK